MSANGVSVGVLTGQLEMEESGFFSGLTNAIRELDMMQTAVVGVTAAVTAVTAAASAAAAGVHELASRGSDVGDIAEQFNFLAQKVGIDNVEALKELRAGTADTVSDFDLMQKSLTLLRMGFKGSAEDMGTMARVSRVLAEGGIPLTQAFEMVTRAVTTGQPRMLARYGINIDLKTSVEELNDSMEAEGKIVDDVALKQVRSQAILKGLNQFIGESAVITDDYNDKIAQQTTRWANLYDTVATRVTNLPSILKGWDAVVTAVEHAFGAEPQRLVDTFVDFVDRAATATSQYLVAAINVGGELWREVSPTLTRVGTLLVDVWEGAKPYVMAFAGVLWNVLVVALRGVNQALDATVGWVKTFKGWLDEAPGPVRTFATTVGGLTLAVWGLNTALGWLAKTAAITSLTGLLSGLSGLSQLIGVMGAGPAMRLFLANMGAASGITTAFTAATSGATAALGTASGPWIAAAAASTAYVAATMNAVMGGKTLKSLQGDIAIALGATAKAANEASIDLSRSADENKKAWEASARAALNAAGTIAGSGLPPIKQATGEVTEATRKFNEEVKALYQTLSGASAAEELKKLERVYSQLGATQLANPIISDNVAEAYNRIRNTIVGPLPKALEELWVKWQEQQRIMQQVASTGDLLARTQSDFPEQLRRKLELAPLQLQVELDPTSFQRGLKNLLSGVQPEIQTLGKTLMSLVSDFPMAVMQSFQGGGGFKGALQGLAGAAGGQIGQQLFGDLAAKGSQTFLSAFGPKVTQMLGTMIPGIGGMIGSLAGPLLGKLFGGNEGKRLDNDATAKIKDLQTELTSTYGSLERIDEIGKAVGVDLAGAWGDRSRAGLEHFSALAEQFAQRLTEVKDVVEEYGITLDQVSDSTASMLLGDTAADIRKDWDAMFHAGMSGENALKALAPQLYDIIEAADKAGVEVPDSVKPIIEQLKNLERQNGRTVLSAEQIAEGYEDLADLQKELADLQDQQLPKWQETNRLAEQYGLSIDGAGQKVQQLKITDLATGLLNDFQTLKDAGWDTTGMLTGMGDEFSELVQDAMKYGVELPANMRPAIESLIQQGALIDASGKKFTDLTGIKFGAPVETEADKISKAITTLMDKISALIDKLSGVSTTAEDVAADLQDSLSTPPWDDWSTPVWPDVASMGEKAATFAGGGVVHLAGGGFVPRGSDVVPAMLTPGERVLSTAEAATYGRGGGKAALYIDRRLFAEILVPEIAGVVQEYSLT